MNIKFDNKFKVDYHVDDKLEACKMPILILQPIVENALMHGLGGREEDARLVIKGRRQGDNIVFEVSDNGAGIPSAMLKSIRDSLAQTELGDFPTPGLRRPRLRPRPHRRHRRHPSPSPAPSSPAPSPAPSSPAPSPAPAPSPTPPPADGWVVDLENGIIIGKDKDSHNPYLLEFSEGRVVITYINSGERVACSYVIRRNEFDWFNKSYLIDITADVPGSATPEKYYFFDITDGTGMRISAYQTELFLGTGVFLYVED